MGCGDTAVIEAAANVAWALCNSGHPAELCFAVTECNSLGAAMIGGTSFESAFETVRGTADTADTAETSADTLLSLKTIFIGAPTLRRSTGFLPPPNTS